MQISFSSDRTGYPLAHLSELGFDVQLLPVTKIQFELFAHTDQTFATIFEHAQALNPASKKTSSDQRIEQELMTGLLPEEALQFAVWLDNNEPTSDYAIPDVKEWRAVYDCLQYERCDPFIAEILDNAPNKHAKNIIQRILSNEPHTLLELSLMRSGVIEWVLHKEDWVGLGKPDAAFYPNTFQPLNETIEPVDPTLRMRTFGFRLIRVF